MSEQFDVVVIGGGQAALAVGYYLRRTSLRYTLVDNQPAPGGAWQHTWPSLRLFSPPQWSSLPGWLMPRDASAGRDDYPTRDAAIAYLREYERGYEIHVRRPVHVTGVRHAENGFALETSSGPIGARAVVSATGTWANPVVPAVDGGGTFEGVVLHSGRSKMPAAVGSRPARRDVGRAA